MQPRLSGAAAPAAVAMMALVRVEGDKLCTESEYGGCQAYRGVPGGCHWTDGAEGGSPCGAGS